MDPQLDGEIRVTTLCNIFTNKKIKDRVDRFISLECFNGGKIQKSPMIKGMRRTLQRFAAKEYQHMKSNLRFVQKRPNKKRSSSHRGSTKYTLFCKQMKAEHGSSLVAGKLQSLWREKNGKPPKKKAEVPDATIPEENKLWSDSDEEDLFDVSDCTHEGKWKQSHYDSDIAYCKDCFTERPVQELIAIGVPVQNNTLFDSHS